MRQTIQLQARYCWLALSDEHGLPWFIDEPHGFRACAHGDSIFIPDSDLHRQDLLASAFAGLYDRTREAPALLGLA